MLKNASKKKQSFEWKKVEVSHKKVEVSHVKVEVSNITISNVFERYLSILFEWVDY